MPDMTDTQKCSVKTSVTHSKHLTVLLCQNSSLDFLIFSSSAFFSLKVKNKKKMCASGVFDCGYYDPLAVESGVTSCYFKNWGVWIARNAAISDVWEDEKWCIMTYLQWRRRGVGVEVTDQDALWRIFAVTWSVSCIRNHGPFIPVQKLTGLLVWSPRK